MTGNATEALGPHHLVPGILGLPDIGDLGENNLLQCIHLSETFHQVLYVSSTEEGHPGIQVKALPPPMDHDLAQPVRSQLGSNMRQRRRKTPLVPQ